VRVCGKTFSVKTGKLLVPDWEDTVESGIGLSYGA
jgi:hypothetical protein